MNAICEPQFEAPAPIALRSASFEGGAVFQPREQPWGKVGFALTGVMEVSVGERRFLSPPHFATWIPAGAAHCCHNRHSVHFMSVYIERTLCASLPEIPCTLALSPLIRAILADFAERNIVVPSTDEDARLALVLIDQFNKAPRRESFLPVTEDPLVRPITDAFQQNPGDRRSLADWAEALDRTERTISRRFQSSLGMSFNEWKQRLKLVAALSMIERGKPVQQIADELGYSTPSAFIAMFRRQTGASPTRLSGDDT